jgi:glycosyltransferase involved in cell wall biosynthesis
MKKTVLIINKFCPLHPKAGGAEKNLLEIFSRIGEKYDVHLLSAMFPGGKQEEFYRNIHIHRFGLPDSENIIRIHLLLPFLVKKYLKIFTPDILFEDVSVLPFFTPLFYPRRKKIIIIHNLNRLQFFKSQKFFYALIGYLAESLFLLLYRKEKTIVVSEWMKQELLRHKFKEVHKVLNGVDEELFNVKKAYAPEPTVLFLGRLENRKGVDLFLKTYPLVKNKIPAVKYVIAGREFQHYQHHPDIKFLDYVSEEEKQKLFSRTWVYVAPSRIEGYGISVIEANATGTFVIANTVEGLKESVIDGKTGILTYCYNPQIFAEEIVRWLDLKKLHAKEKSCRRWAKGHGWQESSREIKLLLGL